MEVGNPMFGDRPVSPEGAQRFARRLPLPLDHLKEEEGLCWGIPLPAIPLPATLRTMTMCDQPAFRVYLSAYLEVTDHFALERQPRPSRR